MNQHLSKSQKHTRFLLYFILIATILINFFNTYFELGINKNRMFVVQGIVSLGVLTIGYAKSIINWKSFWIYLTIALVLLLCAYFRK